VLVEVGGGGIATLIAIGTISSGVGDLELPHARSRADIFFF